ncbi:hypothetical protein F4777DRAFT_22705 [Nemania sp. FL0916]|nr:hypothetical protein F4777DRAFT_22705 [Nemania sp. FL0916]
MGTSRPHDNWATPNAWAKYRPLITALYEGQNKTLKETKRIMEEKHGFTATVRMYKARFQQWGIEKKIKAEDAVEIYRQQTARAKEGKASVAYIRGRKITPDRLQRYRYRAAAIVSEQFLRVDKESSVPSKASSAVSHIVLRTPSPSPPLTRQPQDPVCYKVPIECMQILRNYIAGSAEAGAWSQISSTSTAPVPDAFTWAHYLAMSQGLILHGRTEEGFTLLNICLEQYKSHLMNPDPFFWLATYKAVLLLAHRDKQLGEMFIKYASELSAVMLPPTHPFNRVWSRIRMTGLSGLQHHASTLFEAYLNICKEQDGLLPMDQASMVQIGFVFIQLHCGGMLSYAFTKEVLGDMIRLLSHSVSSQFLLQEAKYRLACLFLDQDKLDEADDVVQQILLWIDSLSPSDRSEFDHLRCKCLWVVFKIEDKRGDSAEATRTGQSLVDLCLSIYGPLHLQTLDAISALADFYRRNNNPGAAQAITEQFNSSWAYFMAMTQKETVFPHVIEQPWLHRCVELEEDERPIQEVVDLFEQNSWLDEPQEIHI